MTVIKFELPSLPKLLNKSLRTYYKKRNNENAKWYSDIKIVVGRKRPKKPFKKFTLKLIRYSSQVPDYDGLVGSFKPIVDGLIQAGVIEDDSYSMSGPWIVKWEKISPKKGKIKVEVIGED